MLLTSFLAFVLGGCSIYAKGISSHERANDNFISVQGSEFYLHGSPFKFVGTNAYWLPTLNADQDIEDTFADISAADIKVVRTWAFDDVTEIPDNGTWFQLIANGTTTLNTGANGLARLDKVVELAEEYGVYLLLSLTNNWNPMVGDNTETIPDVSRRDVSTGNALARNFLSNDFGGMDAYVREFGTTKTHDEFYANDTIIGIFETYVANIVSRYVNSPAILGWEIANDPRCNSTLPSIDCTPQTVTEWHSTMAQFIKSVDPNHIVSSGSGGFLCVGCPKLFPPPTTTLKRSGDRRRNRRAALDSGPAYDGSQGVDSEDILGIPQIGFSSFQLFPDQDSYATSNDPGAPSYSSTVRAGVEWIETQAQAASQYDKPTVATGFGLVTRGNARSYVPFNSSQVSNGTLATGGSGVTDGQRDRAYQTWLQTGVERTNGMIQYQWGEPNLCAEPGAAAAPSNLTGSELSIQGARRTSPNDGYTTNGRGRAGIQSAITFAGEQYGQSSFPPFGQ